MPHQALRTILPIAGWSGDPAASVDLHRRHRSGIADAVPHRRDGCGDAGGGRPRRRRPVGSCAPGGVSRWPSICARRRPRCAAGTYMKLGDGAAFARAQHASWASIQPGTDAGAICIAISPTIAPPHSACSAWRKIATRCARRWPSWDAARPRGGDHCRQRRRRHGAHAGRMGQHPQAAAIAALPLMEIVKIGDSPPEPLPAGDRPLVGHPRARPHARARRADLRTHARRAWRRRHEDHRRASAEPRLPGIRHRPWQALGPSRSARSQVMSRPCAGWCARPMYSRKATGRARLAGRGLSPEELAAMRPGLVYVSLCAFGHAGPWASRRGFDTVVQTVSGITDPPGRARARARRRGRNSIRCRRSTIAPAT